MTLAVDPIPIVEIHADDMIVYMTDPCNETEDVLRQRIASLRHELDTIYNHRNYQFTEIILNYLVCVLRRRYADLHDTQPK